MALTAGQKACVETLDRSIVVAAGAGSGKTFTLKERIAHAFECGYITDVGELCAITYTTKAAAELKSRIKAVLKARGLLEQSLKVDDAWISTIHGMCSRILKAHAVELGIDPAFNVLDPADVDECLAAAVDEVLVRAQASSGSAQIDALFAEYPARSFGGYGESVESMLMALVGKAADNPHGADAFVLPGDTMEPAFAVGQAIESVETLAAHAESQKKGKSRDAWLAEMADVLGDVRKSLEEDAVDCVKALQLIGRFKVRKTFGDSDFKELADETLRQLAALTIEMRLAVAQPHLETLVELARKSLETFAALKRSNNVLDNSDLLVMAARALEEHPEIARCYDNKFKLVMVDEFQDTNQMQVDMIKRIAGPGACRLCTVGDAQQSIYGFRGADVSVYRRHLKSIESSDPNGVIKLVANFRSHSDILAFVDRVFEQPSMFGGQFMSLEAKREEGKEPAFSEGEPRIVVQHTIKHSRSAQPLVVARRIADQFATWRDAGHSAGEMVILLRGMGNSGLFAQALRERGFSCVIAGGSVFAETLEAQIVLDLVRYIANSGQTQSLLNVLVSPMFALTAGDLADVGGGVPKRALRSFGRRRGSQADEIDDLPAKGDGGAADASDPDLTSLHGAFAAADSKRSAPGQAFPGSPELMSALRVIADARAHAAQEPVWVTVQRAVVDSGWFTRLDQQGPEGQASAANIHKAIRKVREVEERGPYGPASVALRFEHLLANAKEPPGALSVSGGDSVRIMTFHASKGLEFPIVAVAGMPSARETSKKLLVTEIDGSIYVSLDAGASAKDFKANSGVEKAVRNCLLDGLDDEDELAKAVVRDEGALYRRLASKAYVSQGDTEESKRLLYVAITRAREACIVACEGNATKDDPSGLPKGVMSGVITALAGSNPHLTEGRSLCQFGGLAPALFDCVELSEQDAEPSETRPDSDDKSPSGNMHSPDEAEEDAAGSGLNSDGEATDANPQREEPAKFAVPSARSQEQPTRQTFKALHEGVFSYSSIADVSHEGDDLARLAARFAIAVEGAQDGDGVAQGDAGQAAASNSPSVGGAESPTYNRSALQPIVLDEDDDPWAFAASTAFDDDRATDLGTAFHRLAQYAVIARQEGSSLAPPPAERIAALSATCNLDSLQKERLALALDRWFRSDVAHDMARQWTNLAAEVPFFVEMPFEEGASPAFLEGEIDLLAISEDGSRACVVDYKTGGHDDESSERLREKHVLQAACYAYAIMLQGVRQVDALFVRVEREHSVTPGQPQYIRYRFSESDMPDLLEAIQLMYERKEV